MRRLERRTFTRTEDVAEADVPTITVTERMFSTRQELREVCAAEEAARRLHPQPSGKRYADLHIEVVDWATRESDLAAFSAAGGVQRVRSALSS